jgi:hypothetical protein
MIGKYNLILVLAVLHVLVHIASSHIFDIFSIFICIFVAYFTSYWYLVPAIFGQAGCPWYLVPSIFGQAGCPWYLVLVIFGQAVEWAKWAKVEWAKVGLSGVGQNRVGQSGVGQSSTWYLVHYLV